MLCGDYVEKLVFQFVKGKPRGYGIEDEQDAARVAQHPDTVSAEIFAGEFVDEVSIFGGSRLPGAILFRIKPSGREIFMAGKAARRLRAADRLDENGNPVSFEHKTV